MDFSLPPSLAQYLRDLDEFIESEIVPLQNQDDNNRFFDHRREHARTDWDAGGLPRKDWEDLLRECRKRADRAGFLRLALPVEYGGQRVEGKRGSVDKTDGVPRGGNLWMAVIREHLAAKGLGLFNDLQTEHSVVGNWPIVVMLREFGNEEQKKRFISGQLDGKESFTFGLTEPRHGSDASFMETVARPEPRNGVDGYRIDGKKKWQTGMHVATTCIIFARTGGKDGEAKGISAFFVPANADGVKVESYEWTFNMPTDHATVSFSNVWVPASSLFGPLHGGLSIAQAFVHENRIRQAASSLGAAVYCIEESVKYARQRRPFGKDLASNQGIQFPLVELATQAEGLRLLIYRTAAEMDRMDFKRVEFELSDRVGMCNFWANRLCCQAADRAMQVHGGVGYSREKPFEHIYRHHRRYRITEGSEEIQMRKVAAHLFGYVGRRKKELAPLPKL